MSQDVPEKELLDAAIAGDIAALEQLLLRYFPDLERHLGPRIPASMRRHVGVEDVLQVVFSQVFRDIGRFQPREEGSFFAWLRTIAEHRLIDALRKIGQGGIHQLSRENFDSSICIQELIDAVAHDSITASRIVAGKEAGQAIQVAIAGLPDDQREVVWSRYIDGKPTNQIAQETGRTDAAVRGLLHRAKENLRIAMGRSSRWFSTG